MTVTSDQQRTARGSRTTSAGTPTRTSPGTPAPTPSAAPDRAAAPAARDGGPDAGSKRTVDLGALTLETGGSLPSVQVA